MTSSEVAASSLMLLSTPPRSSAVAMPLKKRIKIDDEASSQDTCVDALEDDANKALIAKEEDTDEVFSTPVKHFRLCGVKRENEALLRVSYKSDNETIEVPMHVQDTKTTFLARRDRLLKQMFDENRSEVYCSWRDALLSMLVKDARWTLYRESLQQKRYLFKTIQLVVGRFTCTQWRDGDLCRNCSNRNWRAGCQKPTYLLHLMPLPAYRNNVAACEAALAELSPCVVEKDSSDWKKRMPQASVR